MLNDKYKQLIEKRSLIPYRDFAFTGDYVENASVFIRNVFLYAGKTRLAKYRCHYEEEAGAEEMRFRNKHMVSTFLIGHLLAESLYNDGGIDIIQPYDTVPFSYVWYLICLFHDAGYGEEFSGRLREDMLGKIRNEGAAPFLRKSDDGRAEMRAFKKMQHINSSIWFGAYGAKSERQGGGTDRDRERGIAALNGYYKLHRRVNFENGASCKFPAYPSGLVNRYFRYRLIEHKKIDHGIVGGYVFFDEIIKNYLDSFRESGLDFSRFDDFKLYGKRYYKEQISVFGYIADCIIAHNIWKGSGEIYARYGLQSLTGDSYKKVSLRTNPYLFILSLCDNVEPLKILRNSGLSDEQILSRVDFSFNQSGLTIHTEDEFIFNRFNDKLADFGDWAEAVVTADGRAGKIDITFS